MELTDVGFDFSLLSEFRSRLLENKHESLLLEKMLDCFRDKNLLKARGKQRTDSTHILANVRNLNRLESVCETLRAALNVVAKLAPNWLSERITKDWLAQYSRPIEEYRLPKGEKARNEYASLVGSRGFRLLRLIEAADAPAELKELKMVKTLQKMWENQFEIKEDKVQCAPRRRTNHLLENDLIHHMIRKRVTAISERRLGAVIKCISLKPVTKIARI